MQTIDGDPYSEEDWRRRARYEPLAEIIQGKGSSECAVGVGTTDEECHFEQFLPLCDVGESRGWITATSMVRDGLKRGLELQQTLGQNPFRLGFVGSTDTHNSNSGDTEEYDYRGVVGLRESPAVVRMDPETRPRWPMHLTPGGLTGVWADENTSDALFNSLQQREAYAISGTRIRLQFFAGHGYTDDMLYSDTGIAEAYARGVPMGGELLMPTNVEPTFLLRAEMDAMTVPLDCVQVINGWVRDGSSEEKIYDIVCSDGRLPNP